MTTRTAGMLTLAFATITLTVSAATSKPDREMQMVLDALASLGGKPIETLTPAEARKQPTPADAVAKVLKEQGKDTAPEAVAKVENRSIAGPAGQIPIRIYSPKGNGPFPVILYIHGGGWVIANLDTYDASARALTNAAGVVVVSTHYRQGPEHKYPAAHDDTFAAYKWTLASAKSLAGDPARVAVAGESAGGNLAAALKAANVPVTHRNFEGSTHEFFGMGAVVPDAKEAVGFAAGELRKPFGRR